MPMRTLSLQSERVTCNASPSYQHFIFCPLVHNRELQHAIVRESELEEKKLVFTRQNVLTVLWATESTSITKHYA